MPAAPGTISLGKFRAVCEATGAAADDGYCLQQRAVIRLDEKLARIERPEDCTVHCDEAKFTQGTGRKPSPLQYFIASIGFCMFSQMARLAARLEVPLADAEMELRMTYDLRAEKRCADFATAAQELSYLLKIKSSATIEQIIRLAQQTDRSCHTVNSMRNRVAVSGKLRFNDRELEIAD